MNYGPIADRYARAIFELGIETGQVEELTRQVSDFANVYGGSDELRSVLDNPIIEEAKRDAMLRDVASRLGLSQLALNTVRLLAARRRLRALPDVARRLAGLADERSGVLRATVSSAVPLSELYYQQLQGALEKATQRRIVIERRQDPTLIAGVVTRIGDNTIDGSVKGRLTELERQLLQP
jgi:F-type H+-transporting ATPase subunit delta